MDFWDILKLMARRWMVAGPMLLLTVVVGVWTGFTVRPEYQATGHITVLPASVENNSREVKRKVNPWAEEALADAAKLRIEQTKTQEAVAAEGLPGEVVVSIDGMVPVVTIEVKGKTAELAQAAVQRYMTEVEAEVVERQAPFKIPKGEEITTVRLDDGASVKPITSLLKRALVIVIGGGLAVTVLVTVLVDLVLRRRAGTTHKPSAPAAPTPPAVAQRAAPGTPQNPEFPTMILPRSTSSTSTGVG